MSKSEFLPQHISRELQSKHHDELLQSVTADVLKSNLYNTFSMTYRALKILDHLDGNTHAMLDMYDPFSWVRDDEGSNCFGLAYTTQQKLLKEYGIKSVLVPFEADQQPSESIRSYIGYGHGAILVPSRDEFDEPTEHLIDVGFGVPQPLIVDREDSKVNVDGRSFWAEGRGQQALLIARGNELSVRSYHLHSQALDFNELISAQKRLLRTRTKLVVTRQDELGEVASLRLHVDQKNFFLRQRGESSIKIPTSEFLAHKGEIFSMVKKLSYNPDELLEQIEFVVNHLNDYTSKILDQRYYHSNGKLIV